MSLYNGTSSGGGSGGDPDQDLFNLLFLQHEEAKQKRPIHGEILLFDEFNGTPYAYYGFGADNAPYTEPVFRIYRVEHTDARQICPVAKLVRYNVPWADRYNEWTVAVWEGGDGYSVPGIIVYEGGF